MAASYSSSSGDEFEDSTDFEGVQKLDYSHQELDSELLLFHLNDLGNNPERVKFIRKLMLCNNALEILPEPIQNLRNLVELDLSNNVISYLPDVVGTELTSLTHLSLRNNLMRESEFPKNLSGLVNSLRYLNMSGNRLTAIPQQIFQLRELTGLYLGGNQITEIQSDIKLMKKLKFLYLGGNFLQKLPKEICHLEKLQALFLCFNMLESLPDCICRLKKLRCLQLHSNKLTTLPNGLIFLNSLTELSLRDNPLVVRFVRQMDYQVSSLLELSARVVKVNRLHYTEADLPRGLANYLESGQHCVNPKCCGVYFESRVEHIKFVDFCGKYRIPLMQYLCSTNCHADKPAVIIENSDDESHRMKRVLLG